MKNVYVVMFDHGMCLEHKGIFSSEAKAQKFLDTFYPENKFEHRSFYSKIVEVELDKAVDF